MQDDDVDLVELEDKIFREVVKINVVRLCLEHVSPYNLLHVNF